MSSSDSTRLFVPPESLKSYGSNVASVPQTEEVLDEGAPTPSRHHLERSPLVLSGANSDIVHSQTPGGLGRTFCPTQPASKRQSYNAEMAGD